MNIPINDSTDRADTPVPAYHAQELESLAIALLAKAGLPASMAAVVAKTLIEGDLLGHDTHGLALLPGYLKELQSGSMQSQGSHVVISDKPAVAVWDGNRQPGPWLIEQGLDMLIPRARARRYGLACDSAQPPHRLPSRLSHARCQRRIPDGAR